MNLDLLKDVDPQEKPYQEISVAFRVQRSLVRVQRSLVVFALGCCTAAPGSNPARHPTLGPAG
jgi:hypothetical protein